MTNWRLGRGKTPGDPLPPSHPTACAPGVWGPQCDKPCNCGNSSSCDPKSGACSCASGLQPPHCSRPCSPGRYGPACQFSCQCHGAPCDPQTGACLCPPERTGPRCVTGGTHTNGIADTGCTGIRGDTRGLSIPNVGMESRGPDSGPSSAARWLSNLEQIIDSSRVCFRSVKWEQYCPPRRVAVKITRTSV